MNEILNNIIEKPFKVCKKIAEYDKLLLFTINDAPQPLLFKFLIRSMPIWKNYDKKMWVDVMLSVNNEIGFLNLSIFFGRYLKIDLIKSIKDIYEIDIKYISFASDYLTKNTSIFHLFDSPESHDYRYYSNELEFEHIQNRLIVEGFERIDQVNPPEIINI